MDESLQPRVSHPVSQPVPRGTHAASQPVHPPPQSRVQAKPQARSTWSQPAPEPEPIQDDADAEIEQQIMELIDRARASEERAVYAEQQLAMHLSSVPPRPVMPALDLEMPAPQRSAGGMLPWLVSLVLCGLIGAGYFLGYAPLHAQYDAQVKLGQAQSAQHAQELASLRSSFDDERSKLESQLTAAQAAAAAAAAQAEPDAAQPAAAGMPAAKSKSAAAADARAARLEEMKAAREARRQERLAKRAERMEKRKQALAAHKSSSHKAAHGDADDDTASAKPAKAPAASKPASDGDKAGVGSGDDPLEGL